MNFKEKRRKQFPAPVFSFQSVESGEITSHFPNSVKPAALDATLNSFPVSTTVETRLIKNVAKNPSSKQHAKFSEVG
ncbi:MAG: hypothetical protein ACQEXX_00170 [Bacillota bacterium]